MIAHRIERKPHQSSNPAKLVRYMVAAKGGIDPTSWQRTADYILDTANDTAKGEKVESYRVTNCGTDDPADAAILILATQAANTRSKGEKTYHMVFSFQAGERPPLEVLHAIEDELCESIGLGDHQRVSAVHVDTDHLHVHVAINKVHPTGLQNIEPYYDKRRLMEACERLEVQYGLRHDDHGLGDRNHEHTRERSDRIQLDRGQRPEQRDSRFRRYLRESYDLSFADEPEAKTLNGLRTLSGCRMVRASERTSVLLPGDTRGDLQQRGKERTDGLRRPGHGDRTAIGQTGSGGRGRVSGKAADAEAHSGIETLTGYAARELAPAMRQATNWQELHDAAAEHGLEVRQRGAGLVIGEPDLGIWAKASNVGRDLSMKALTDRLGPFQPSERQAEAKANRKRYEPRPRRSDTPTTAGLFNQYQRERQAAILARRQGLDQIKRESAAFTAQVRQWSQTERMLLKVAGKGPTKRLMYGTIKQQADASRQKNRQSADARRQALFKQTAMPTWADWLTQQAERGNAEALAVLRDREERTRRWNGELLTADRADKAKAVVLDKLKPKARKDGTMAYSTIDGGMVIDRKTHVQAQKATTGAALVALELASKRFEGQALIVEGTDEFRLEVAQLAGMHGLKVTFTDPAMEQMRRETAEHKEMEKAFQAEIKASSRDDFAELVDFGKAPFEHVKGNRKSYFVTLRDGNGEDRTLWGVDLERAVANSGAAVGDRVRVNHMGSESVTLPDGRTVERNEWRMETAPKGSQTAKPKPNRPTPAPNDMDAAFLAETGLSGKTTGNRTGGKPAQPVDSGPAVQKWIEERNKNRDKISSIDYHRLWQSTDAGRATYQGRRRMEDGSEVLLLKRGDEMLVKPSTPRVVAKAATWKLGRVVQLDGRGRFTDRSNEVEL